jgi:hypothetical protein
VLFLYSRIIFIIITFIILFLLIVIYYVFSYLVYISMISLINKRNETGMHDNLFLTTLAMLGKRDTTQTLTTKHLIN